MRNPCSVPKHKGATVVVSRETYNDSAEHFHLSRVRLCDVADLRRRAVTGHYRWDTDEILLND